MDSLDQKTNLLARNLYIFFKLFFYTFIQPIDYKRFFHVPIFFFNKFFKFINFQHFFFVRKN